MHLLLFICCSLLMVKVFGQNCPPGTPVATCLPLPCRIASCPGRPDAVCRNNFCGRCSTSFIDRRGNELNDFQCCPNLLTLSCFANRCERASCPGEPNALCVQNRCDCGVRFYNVETGRFLSEQECNRDDEPQSECPTGVPVASCRPLPCLLATCPGVPGATCTNNFCNGCSAVFRDSNGNELDDSRCCPNLAALSCPSNRCQRASCPGVLEAQCFPNRCDCGVTFVNSAGSILTDEQCNRIQCRPDEPQASCSPLPCLLASCPGVPDATCINSFCSGCSAVFRDRRGIVLSDSQCCPNLPALTCAANRCQTASCPGVPDARCFPNRCDCGVTFVDSSGNVVTMQQCFPVDRRCSQTSYPIACTRISQTCPQQCPRGRICCPRNCEQFCAIPVSTCEPVVDPKADIEFTLSCSNGDRQGSTCIAKCPDGQTLVGGPARTQCLGSFGFFTRRAPTWRQGTLTNAKCEVRPTTTSRSCSNLANCLVRNTNLCGLRTCSAFPGAICVPDPCTCSYNFYFGGLKIPRNFCSSSSFNTGSLLSSFLGR
ncbi:unnamed protein product [Clavelina lepadiformis]|uniref:Uncharacterized protein n=1 Tax=Clavelina lepadiformis TaxID=159417 RepID=A0ABP0H392_CLALP